MKNLPNPNGCGICGIDQRGHGIQVTADGSHTWEQPTQEQIKARMQDRRTAQDDSGTDCAAVRYGDRSLCGCMDCIEYTAEQDSYDV